MTFAAGDDLPPVTDEDGPLTRAIKEGRCPGCLGTGRVSRLVPVEDDNALCSTCHGSGRWPPPDEGEIPDQVVAP